jgi:hypothetical protein
MTSMGVEIGTKAFEAAAFGTTGRMLAAGRPAVLCVSGRVRILSRVPSRTMMRGNAGAEYNSAAYIAGSALTSSDYRDVASEEWSTWL